MRGINNHTGGHGKTKNNQHISNNNNNNGGNQSPGSRLHAMKRKKNMNMNITTRGPGDCVR